MNQIALLCLSQEQINQGKRLVKISASEARDMGLLRREPGPYQSKVQRVRAAKAAQVAAAKATARTERKERRQRRRRRGRR